MAIFPFHSLKIPASMFRFLLLLSVCLFSATAFSQNYTTRKTTTEKARNLYDEGKAASRMEDWERALRYFRKALDEDSKLIDASIYICSVQYEQGKYNDSRNCLLKVLETAPDYHENLYYQLGVTEWKLNLFESAAARFDRFLKMEKLPGQRTESARSYLANSLFSAEAVKHPVPFQPQRFSDSINSKAAEYLPLLTADGETLIFTRNDGGEDFYVAKKKNGVWQKAYPMQSINSEWNEGAQTVSADGRFFVFTGCNREDGLGACDLYFTEQTKPGEWSEPKNLGAPVNTRNWESQPSLSADGKTLYFVAERAGNIGGLDIWLTQRGDDGKWSAPTNLGKQINTRYDDQAPFIHPDGKTLYFMSKGYPGMGGFDLYFSKKQPDGSWSKPQNLGYPINTKAHEGSLFVSLDGKTAFFSSDKTDFNGMNVEDSDNPFDKPGADRTSDIFYFELAPALRPDPVTYVKATVKDASIRVPLVADVEFIDLATGKVLFADQTGTDGVFLVCLPMGKDYALNVSKEGYLFQSENFALKTIASFDQPFLLDIQLQKIIAAAPASDGGKPQTSQPIVLKNVFFETASAELRPESVAELQRLKKLLTDNPTLKIEIHGHTDNVGSDADNLQLSTQRAKAVYDFLTQQEVAAARLAFKGFGESQPVDSNDTPQGRQNNRRTEFVVVY